MLCGLWLFRKDEKHYKCLFFCVGASLFVIPKLILFFYQNLEVIPTGRIDIIYFSPIIIESKIKSCTFHEWITLLQFLVKKKSWKRHRLWKEMPRCHETDNKNRVTGWVASRVPLAGAVISNCQTNRLTSPPGCTHMTCLRNPTVVLYLFGIRKGAPPNPI